MKWEQRVSKRYDGTTFNVAEFYVGTHSVTCYDDKWHICDGTECGLVDEGRATSIEDSKRQAEEALMEQLRPYYDFFMSQEFPPGRGL